MAYPAPFVFSVSKRIDWLLNYLNCRAWLGVVSKLKPNVWSLAAKETRTPGLRTVHRNECILNLSRSSAYGMDYLTSS